MRAFLVAAALCAATAVHADPVADFYRGKTVTLMIGGGPGGAYDIYARLFARHWPRHMPGNPVVVPKNLSTAGGLAVANMMANGVEKDGLTVAAHSNGISLDPLLGNPGARFDARKFGWIGSIGKLQNVCVTWRSSPVKTIEQARVSEVVLAGHAPTMNTVIFPRILNSLLGTKFRVVGGYEPGQGHAIAMENGEVDGVCGLAWATIKASHPEWIAERKINVLLQMAFDKLPDLPDVPNAPDLLTSPDDRRMLDLVLTRQEIGRGIAGPPGLPPERLAALRASFDATMKDPEFLADAAKAQMDIEPLSGEAIDRLLASAYATPGDIVKRAAAFVEAGEGAK